MKKVHGIPLYGTTIFVVAFLTGLASCQNFLDGSQLRKQIEDQIDFSNASSYDLNISSNYGKISPNGTITKKETESVELTFTPDSDYQFIYWKAYSDSAKTNELSADYISFDEAEENNTSFTFNKALADGGKIYIEPVCVKRPNVVTEVPEYEPGGVCCDSSITVMFDQKMDETSIYYSEDEQKLLEADGFTLLKDGEKCYGYWDGETAASIVYKNISITKRTGGTNLLEHYGIPQFDTNDTSILRIGVNKKNPPDVVTSIVVTLSKNFNFYDETFKKSITLGSDFKWSYYTNASDDEDPPEIAGIGVYYTDENGRKINSRKLSYISTYFSTTEEITQRIEANLLTSGKIWVEGTITDGASGPASLKWECSTLKTPILYYLQSSEEVIASGEFTMDINGETSGTIMHTEGDILKEGCCVDLSEVLKGKKGVYDFNITAADANGNKNSKGFQFIYDEDLYKAAESEHMKAYRDDKGIKIEVKNTGDGYSINHICSYDSDYLLKVEAPDTIGETNTYYFEFTEKDKPYTLFLCYGNHDKDEAVIIKAGGGTAAPFDLTTEEKKNAYDNFGVEISNDYYHTFKISSDPREFINFEDAQLTDAKIGIDFYSGASEGSVSPATEVFFPIIKPENISFSSNYYHYQFNESRSNFDSDELKDYDFDTNEEIDTYISFLLGNKEKLMSVNYCFDNGKMDLCSRTTWSARASVYLTYDGLEYQKLFNSSTKSENVTFCIPYYVLHINDESGLLDNLVKVYYWQARWYKLDGTASHDLDWALDSNNESSFYGNRKFEGFYLDETFDTSKIYYTGTDCLDLGLMEQIIAEADRTGLTEFTLYTKWTETTASE